MSYISCSDAVGQLVTQPNICSIIESFINLFSHWLSRPCSHSRSQVHRFIHAFGPLVSQRLHRPADWNSADADTDVSVLVRLGQARSPPGAAGCQLTSWCFYPPLAPIQPGRATTAIHYHLSPSFFGLHVKVERRLRTVARVHFTKTVCAPHVRFLCLGFMSPYWVLLAEAFIVLISRDPSSPLRFVCFRQRKINTETEHRSEKESMNLWF